MPTLPISYIYFSWWQLRCTTQHSKYKWCYVRGYVSDRFAASKRDFKILVPERFPVPEGGRDAARRAPQVRVRAREELRARWMWKWSCARKPRGGAGRADGGGRRCQSHDGMAQIASREWGNTAKQGNWEHKDGRRESRRKAKLFSRMKKWGYVRRTCRASSRGPQAPLLAPLPWSPARRLHAQDHTASGSCALCSRLVSSKGSHLEKIRRPGWGEVSFFPSPCLPGLSTLSTLTASALTSSHCSCPQACAWSGLPACASPGVGPHPWFVSLSSHSHLCKQSLDLMLGKMPSSSGWDPDSHRELQVPTSDFKEIDEGHNELRGE